MKKIIYLAIIALIFTSCTDDDPQPEQKPTIQTVKLSMGAGYANDIYYSLQNGLISTAPRDEWDIAFYTNPMSSSILTNDGNGVELYVWPNGDKDAWESVDTTGIANWNTLYNVYNDTTWQNGAFDYGAYGQLYYGWGAYDQNTHYVYGDSIHILLFADGSAKKLFIEKGKGMTNEFHFKYSDIDGENEVNEILLCADYTDLNLIHYSIINQKAIDHEPVATEWDMVFTKYMAEIDMGGMLVPYPVTGVLCNNDIQIAKLVETDTASNDYVTAEFSKIINTVGSDWKSFNMETFSYDILENQLYFVKDLNGKTYKIVFTGFDMSTGDIEFVQTTYPE